MSQSSGHQCCAFKNVCRLVEQRCPEHTNNSSVVDMAVWAVWALFRKAINLCILQIGWSKDARCWRAPRQSSPRQRKVILFLSKFSCFFLKKEASGPLRSCVIMVQLATANSNLDSKPTTLDKPKCEFSLGFNARAKGWSGWSTPNS